MKAVLTLAWKDMLLLLRDRTGFVVTFVSPLIYAVFFGIIFSGRLGSLHRSHITIVDQDRTASSKLVIEALSRKAGLDVRVADQEQALEAFRLGHTDLCILIPAGFEDRAKLQDETNLSVIELAIRPDRNLLSQLLARDIPELDPFGGGNFATSLNVTVKNDSIESRSLAGAVAGSSKRVARHGPENVYAIAFPQGITWGVLGCVAAFGLSIVVERNRGTLSRLRVAPITRAQILAGKAIACFATLLLLEVLLFAISWICFGVRPESIGLLMLAMLSVSIAFVGMMMFLSVWGRTEQAASSIMWTVLLGMSMIGGGMVPRFLMPTWLQNLGDFSPVRWAILAMDGAVWRGFAGGEMFQPCAVLILIGLSCFTVGVLVFRWVN